MDIKSNLLLLPALALTFSCCQKAARPNIVIIYADEMGYGDLACQYPRSKIPAPNPDRLTSEGMRFTNAHSAASMSSPSRYSLLTGRYHWRGFAGITLPNDAAEDSFDLSGSFEGNPGGKPVREFLVHHSDNGFAVRKDNWILIESPSAEVSKEPDWFKQNIGAKPDTTPMILYNLQDDPKQITNLYNSYHEKVNELRALLDNLREEGRSTPLVRGK